MLQILKQINKEKAFLGCLQYDLDAMEFDEQKIIVDSTYTGPVIEHETVITQELIKEVMEY